MSEKVYSIPMPVVRNALEQLCRALGDTWLASEIDEAELLLPPKLFRRLLSEAATWTFITRGGEPTTTDDVKEVQFRGENSLTLRVKSNAD